MISQSSPSTQHRPTEPQNANPLIAFIDDDEYVRDAATQLMESYGLNAKTYASGTVFISDLNNDCNPSCIVLDLHLPDINAIDLMQELLSRKIHTPVIILSADVLHPLAVQALELGAVKILQKPTISEELLEKIHEIISPRSDLYV
jgi:FixJ family two-component response regulator